MLVLFLITTYLGGDEMVQSPLANYRFPLASNLFHIESSTILPIRSLKVLKLKITYQCKILIVTEEGWFGQPKYSTPTKKSFYVVSTSASIFFILYVKPIRSLLIQRTPAGLSFRLFA